MGRATGLEIARLTTVFLAKNKHHKQCRSYACGHFLFSTDIEKLNCRLSAENFNYSELYMLGNSSRHFTVDNWGYSPQNHQSFQPVQSLFPTARLRRGPGPVTTFGRV